MWFSSNRCVFFVFCVCFCLIILLLNRWTLPWSSLSSQYESNFFILFIFQFWFRKNGKNRTKATANTLKQSKRQPSIQYNTIAQNLRKMYIQWRTDTVHRHIDTSIRIPTPLSCSIVTYNQIHIYLLGATILIKQNHTERTKKKFTLQDRPGRQANKQAGSQSHNRPEARSRFLFVQFHLPLVVDYQKKKKGKEKKQRTKTKPKKKYCEILCISVRSGSVKFVNSKNKKKKKYPKVH